MIKFLCLVLLAVDAAAPSLPEKVATPGYARVEADVATGGQPSSAALAALRESGVKTVVSLRTAEETDLAAERKDVEGLGMSFVSIPVAGADFLPEAVDALRSLARDTTARPLFVHCASGNRVAALWMMHRVLDGGWSVDKAEGEARQIGIQDAALTAAKAYLDQHRPAAEPSKP